MHWMSEIYIVIFMSAWTRGQFQNKSGPWSIETVMEPGAIITCHCLLKLKMPYWDKNAHLGNQSGFPFFYML